MHWQNPRDREVTARELARRTASVLDEVEQEGCEIAVARYGRIVARLIPATRAAGAHNGVGPGCSRSEEGDEQLTKEEAAEIVAEANLTPAMKDMLFAVEADPFMAGTLNRERSPEKRNEMLMGLTRLEMGGLISKGFVNYEILDEGRRVLGALKRLDEPARAAITEASQDSEPLG